MPSSFAVKSPSKCLRPRPPPEAHANQVSSKRTPALRSCTKRVIRVLVLKLISQKQLQCPSPGMGQMPAHSPVIKRSVQSWDVRDRHRQTLVSGVSEIDISVKCSGYLPRNCP